MEPNSTLLEVCRLRAGTPVPLSGGGEEGAGLGLAAFGERIGLGLTPGGVSEFGLEFVDGAGCGGFGLFGVSELFPGSEGEFGDG